MTTLHTSQQRRALAAPAMAGTGLALALVIIFAANYHVGNGENGGTGPALITATGCLILTAVLFGYVLPRSRRGTKAAVILSALAIVSLVIFWSGATPVLAAASLAATISATPPSRGVRTGQAVAVLAAAAALTVALAQSHLF